MEDFIRVYENAVSAKDCEQIIQKFKSSSGTRRGLSGPDVDANIKDSIDLNITNLADWVAVKDLITDAVLACLVQYMSEFPFTLVGANIPIFRHPESGEVCKLTFENFEEFGRPYVDTLISQTYRMGQLNVQRYEQSKGGYHHWHSEICADDPECETLHRALFFILYLNDVSEGGETEFYYQKTRVAPKSGRIILSPAGFTHTHKGHTPTSGEKLIATSWIMFNRFQQ